MLKALEAVLADPDSDAARRAFGEEMRDADPKWAELINLQLAIAGLHREHGPATAWIPTFRKIKTLLAAHGHRFCAALGRISEQGLIDPVVSPQYAVDIRRGFVEHVAMTARNFAESAPRVFEVAPIRFVTLHEVMSTPDVLSSPHLAQIAAVRIPDQHIDDRVLAHLAASPAAARLRWFSSPNSHVTRKGLEMICTSPHLRDLLYCDVAGARVEDPMETWSSESEAVVSTQPTQLGQQLEAAFGRQPWIHAPSYFALSYPPDFEAAADSLPDAPGV